MAIETKNDLVQTVERLVERWSIRRATEPLSAIESSWPMRNFETEDFARLLDGLDKARSSSQLAAREREELEEVVSLLERWIYRC